MDNNKKPTISTGGIPFLVKNSNKTPSTVKQKHCHILVLGNFSGNSASDIKSKKIIEVDRDNYDDVFESLKVQLDLPLTDEPIRFRELDEMHPDTLYEKIPLFSRLRGLRKRLQSKEGFSEAAKEFSTWLKTQSEAKLTINTSQPEPTRQEKVIDNSVSSDLLDMLLTEASSTQQTPEAGIEDLARSLVSPYIEDMADPRQQDFVDAVDLATSQLMRKIMHNSVFQSIEGSWRSLYLLIKRLETDAQLKIFICDVSQKSLNEDISAVESIEDSELYKKLVTSRESAGNKAFSLIVGDYVIRDRLSDLHLAAALGSIASSLNASAIVGGDEKLAGCRNIFDQQDTSDWDYPLDEVFTSAWQSLRQDPIANHLSIVAPGYLARMPYGPNSTTTESFEFNELSEQHNPNYYLWGNGAFLVACLIASNYSRFEWSINDAWEHQVRDMPMHVYKDDDGDSVVMSCAKINMTDSFAGAMREQGITVIRSIQNQNAVLVPAFTSVSSSQEYLQGPITY